MGKSWAERLTSSWLRAAGGAGEILRAATCGVQREMFMLEAEQHFKDAAGKALCMCDDPACVGGRGPGEPEGRPWLNCPYLPCSWGSPFWALAHILDASRISLQDSGSS